MSAIKAHTTCFRCKQKFTSKNQANIHQRYCTSLVKSDGMGREFLESFSTTFTQSALSKDIQQGNIRNPHSFQVGGAYRSQLLQYNSLSRQRWTSNTIQRYGSSSSNNSFSERYGSSSSFNSFSEQDAVENDVNFEPEVHSTTTNVEVSNPVNHILSSWIDAQYFNYILNVSWCKFIYYTH